jgi:hypothetical protein
MALLTQVTHRATLPIVSSGQHRHGRWIVQHRRTVVGLLVTLGSGAAVLTLAAFGLSHKGPNDGRLDAAVVGTAATAQGSLKHATLELAT